MSLSRRTILFAAAGAFSLGAPSLVTAATPSAATLLRLRALMRPRTSARALGVAYLAQFPEERDPIVLARLLLPEFALSEAAMARLDNRQLRDRVAARQRADFVQGRIVSLDGWLLSRTEARLAALSVFSEGAIGTG
jgi:hypothetical protein